jgi:SOS-response transcriptional repressor LexA
MKSVSKRGQPEPVRSLLENLWARDATGFPPLISWECFPSCALPGERYCSVSLFGDCLSHIGVFHGDTAILRRDDRVPDGSLAVVLTRQSPLIKFLHYEPDGRIRLDTGAPDFEPTYYKASDIRVIGEVVRIERDLRRSPLTANRKAVK